MTTKRTQDDSQLAETVETLKDDFKRFRDDIRDLVSDMASAGKEGARSAGRHLRNGAKHGTDEVGERLHEARDYGSDKLASIDENVKTHPYMTALIALGVGAIAGRLFRH